MKLLLTLAALFIAWTIERTLTVLFGADNHHPYAGGLTL